MKPFAKLPAEFRFWTGLAALFPYLFLESMILRGFLVFYFILLAILSGKRFKAAPNLLMLGGIVLAHLFIPNGRILWEWGPLTLTVGSLQNGLTKGFLVIGLIYLSRLTVSPQLAIPGRAGALFSLTFYYFEELSGGPRLTRTSLISQIDKRLLEMDAKTASPAPRPAPAEGGALRRALYLSLLLLPVWTAAAGERLYALLG